MKIVRDGVEYELTEQELLSAYYEQDNKFNREDVEENIEEIMEKEKDKLFGYEINSEEDRKQFIDDVLDKYEEYLSGDEGWLTKLEHAVFAVAEEKEIEKSIDRFNDEKALDEVINRMKSAEVQGQSKMAKPTLYREGRDL